MTPLTQWRGFPALKDPRLPVACILFCYLVLGMTVLGFNRNPMQVAVTVSTAVVLELLFHRLLVGGPPLFPFSALITGMGLSILINYAHGYVLAAVPPLFAIGSKYLITLRGRHVYNPAMFGVVACLLLTNGMISDSPAYQWGGSYAIAAFIVTLALFFFVLRINRMVLILSFLGFYSITLLVRAYLTRWHMPMETWLIGAVTNPTLYLFVFFMITDPQTSPGTRKGQIFVAFAIAAIDFVLHLKESLSTFFYAAFLVTTLRYVWFQGQALMQDWRGQSAGAKPQPGAAPDSNNQTGITIQGNTTENSSANGSSNPVPAAGWRPALRNLGGKLRFIGRRWLILASTGGLLWLGAHSMAAMDPVWQADFRLAEIPAQQAGLSSRQGDVLQQVDPRVAHIAKWMLSVGDAVAVADVDNDGLQDIFVTYPLKDARDRAALYKNLGNFRFERIALPEISTLFATPAQNGLPSGAMFFDYDNDGDQDLLLMVGYGQTRLYKNMLVESGKLAFADISAQAGLQDYTISIAANAADYNHDGKLDLILGNVMSPNLLAYEQPVPLNIFKLPQPAFNGDRRMFDFMHRTWHSANNGGGMHLWHNTGSGFAKLPLAQLGLTGESRWTTAIGFGDLDGDGWPDLYASNDFGPDQLLLNQRNGQFSMVKGKIIGQIGRDTYKGMNVSFLDADNNGFNDIYVSNVHEKLQAEGSLLWMNGGTRGGNFGDKSGSVTGSSAATADAASIWQDQAMARNALNERRFGWGAATGDIDLDGKVDILQANGMVDNAYDKLYPGCPDYWYWNDKIALTRPDIHGMADRWADLRGRCIFGNEKNRVYLNRGGHFLDVADQVGWSASGTSRGVALADLDNDGRLDVLVTHQFAPLSIYHNLAGSAQPGASSTPPARRWLGLQLQGNGQSCNRDAIGSKVVLHYRPADKQSGPLQTQWREVLNINGFSAQNDRRLVFGLGNAAHAANNKSANAAEKKSANTVDLLQVSVYWCGQSRAQEYNLVSDRYHVLRQDGGN